MESKSHFHVEPNAEQSPVLFHLAGIGEVEVWLCLATCIHDVKRFANEACNFDLQKMVVMYDGMQLQDSDTLMCYSSNAGCAVHLLSVSNEIPTVRASKQVNAYNPFRAALSLFSNKGSQRHSRSPKRNVSTPMDSPVANYGFRVAHFFVGEPNGGIDYEQPSKTGSVDTVQKDEAEIADSLTEQRRELGDQEVNLDWGQMMDLTPGLKVYGMGSINDEDSTSNDFLEFMEEVMWALLNRGVGRLMLCDMPTEHSEAALQREACEVAACGKHLTGIILWVMMVLTFLLQVVPFLEEKIKETKTINEEANSVQTAVMASRQQSRPRRQRRKGPVHPLLRPKARKYHGKF